MNSIIHCTAKPSHYNQEADHYDAVNEKNSTVINKVIEKILRKYKVKTVLDLTCGTGSQVFHLKKCGYEVVGVDINQKMLTIAKIKARQSKKDIKLIKGDMRTTYAGHFDAVITIFNAIGHLTKKDFERAIKNILANLNHGGLYLFDIFNLSYLLKNDNITKLTIDIQKQVGDILVREIQYSTIDAQGILASYDIYYKQKAFQAPKISTAFQTLQVYNSKQLKELLYHHGFKVLQQCSIDGSRFYENKTERLLIVAQKQ